MKHSIRFSVFLLCITQIVFLSFSSPAKAKSAFPDSTILAPGDTISIAVTENSPLRQIAGNYTIAPSGAISLGNIGEIPASGKPLATLQKNIQKLFHNATATDSAAKVSLTGQNRFILLANGVRYPGWYQVPLHPSLEELVTIASGLQPGAETKGAKIIRRTSGKTKEISFAKALPLRSFDKLTLPVKNNSAIVDNGDLLYVIIPREVTGEFSPTERNYFKEKVEVDRHGFIFMPSQGNIKIAGHTTADISKMLTANLPKYLSKSDKATVNLIEKRHYVQILGHVSTPGWYNIPESANIQTILGQAGGALDNADLKRLSISRRDGTGSKALMADIEYYLSRGDNRMLPVLHENDAVFVPLALTVAEESAGTTVQTATNIPVIRIFGAVNSPGIYPAPTGMNLLDLLITAQGEAQGADISQIKIMRADGGRDIFNLRALLDAESTEKKTTFPMIYGGDIVHIARMVTATNPITGQTMPMLPQTITLTGPGSTGGGLRPFTSGMTPLEAIAQAGGVNEFADADEIIVIRRINGKQERLEYDYDNALEGKMPDVDFQLLAGDIIYIP